MCTSGENSGYEPTPVPKAVPGATSVATGDTADNSLALSNALSKQRRRKGAAATVRNEGGAEGLTTSESTGKKLFGE